VPVVAHDALGAAYVIAAQWLVPSQKNPAASQQFAVPTERGSHAAPTVTPEGWHVPVVAFAAATTQLVPATHAVVTPRSHVAFTPTVVTHVPVDAAHVMPRGHVMPVALPHPSPSVPIFVHRPHDVPTRSHMSVAHVAATPHASPAFPVPTMAHASFGVSIAFGTGPLLHAPAICASDAEHASMYCCVTPLPATPKLLVHSAVRALVHAAALPYVVASMPGSHAPR
jgi:hypothetical protein